MSGVKYYRIKRGLSREMLSMIVGISIPTLKKMENSKIPGTISALKYIKVANALEVTPDELIRSNFPDFGDDFPKRSPYLSKTEDLSNCISVYRRVNSLTYQGLATRLGITSRERARQICSEKIPIFKHLETIARYENISTIDFIKKYSMIKEKVNNAGNN